MNLHTRILAICAPLLLVAAACGGSTGEGAPGPTTAAKESAPVVPKTLTLIGDTVRGTAGLLEEEKSVLTCVVMSKFPQGGRIVWRIRVLDSATSKPIDDKGMASVTLTLPDGKTQAFKYGPHGGTKEAPADFFWVTGYTVPADYPTGVFSYKIDAKSLEGATGTFGFDYFKVPSGQLTIVPAPFPKR